MFCFQSTPFPDWVPFVNCLEKVGSPQIAHRSTPSSTPLPDSPVKYPSGTALRNAGAAPECAVLRGYPVESPVGSPLEYSLATYWAHL